MNFNFSGMNMFPSGMEIRNGNQVIRMGPGGMTIRQGSNIIEMNSRGMNIQNGSSTIQMSTNDRDIIINGNRIPSRGGASINVPTTTIQTNYVREEETQYSDNDFEDIPDEVNASNEFDAAEDLEDFSADPFFNRPLFNNEFNNEEDYVNNWDFNINSVHANVEIDENGIFNSSEGDFELNNNLNEDGDEEVEVQRPQFQMPISYPTFNYDKKGGREENCAICLEEFAARQNCRRIPCFHIFHKECIDSWLIKSRTCPLCKCRC